MSNTKKRQLKQSASRRKAQLTVRHAFAEHFAMYRNALRAYLWAVDRNGKRKVKESTASTEGHKLLKVSEVVGMVDAEQKKLREERRHTLDDVVDNLETAAGLDVAELMDRGGDMLPIEELPVYVRRSLEGLKVTHKRYTSKDGAVEETTTIEPKLQNKTKCNDLLMRHLGGYEKDNAQTVPNALSAFLERCGNSVSPSADLGAEAE